MTDPMANLIPKVPTAAELLRQSLPKELRPPRASARRSSNQRRRPRVTIQELNTYGVAAVRRKWPGLAKQREGLKHAIDSRSALEKVFDFIDVPRNVIANIIGGLVGVQRKKLPRATMGLPRVMMSDVLNKLGVRNAVARGVVGFIGDVAIDPLTYLSAGALTGRHVARGLPRVLPGAKKAVVAAQKTVEAAVRTGRVPSIVAKAVGGASIKGLKPQAVMQLIAKNVGRGDEVGKAARAFFTEFGVKGRHVLRVPFTQIKTAPLKWGAKAKAYKAVSTVGEKGASALRWINRWGMALQAKRLVAARDAAQQAIRVKDAAGLRVAYGQARSYLAGLKREYIQLERAARSAAKQGLGQVPRRVPVPVAGVRQLQRRMDMAEGLLDWMRQRASTLRSSKSWSKRDAQALRDIMRAGPLTGQAVTRGVEGKGIRVVKAAVEMPGVRPFQQIAARGDITAKAKNLQELRRYMRGVKTYRQLPPELAAARGQLGRAKVDVAGIQAARQAVRGQLAQGVGGLRKVARRMERMGGRKLEALRKRPALYDVLETAARGRTFKGPIGRAAQRLFGAGLTSPQRLQELRIQGRATLGASGAGRRIFHALRGPVDDLAKKFAPLVGGDQNKARQLVGHALDIGSPENLAKLHPTEVDLIRKTMPGLQQVWTDPAFGKLKTQFDDMMLKVLQAEQGMGIPVSGARDLGYYPRTLTPEASTARAAQAEATRQGMGVGGEAAQGFRAARVRRFEIVDKAGAARTVVSQPEKVKELLRTGEKLTGQEWAVSAAEHQRMLADPKQYTHLIGTGVERAQFGGQMFQMDPARAGAGRARQHQRAMAAAEMQKLVQATGVPVTPKTSNMLQEAGYQVVREIDEKNPLWSIMGGAGPYSSKGRMIAQPKPVAEMLERYHNMFQRNADIETLVRPFDWTMGWFKRWALYSPAFMARNVWQNMFGTLMSGGPRILAGQARHQLGRPSFAILGAIGADDLSRLGRQTTKVAGKDASLAMLAREFVRWNGTMAAGSIADFTPEMMRGGGSLAGGTRGAYKAVSTGADAIRRMNAAMETHMRFGTWMAFLDEGYSTREAMMRTLRAMPDMSDLTKVEREVGRRIMPWYSWFRRNGALQLLHYLPQQPAWVAGTSKFQNFVEAVSPFWRGQEGTVPKELRPEWMREMQAPQVLGGPEEGSAFLLRTWFPFEEVTTAMAAPFNIGETTRWFAGQTRPGIKFIYETATGRDIFRQAPVAPISMAEMVGAAPAALSGSSETALDNLLAMRPLREARRIGEQPTVAGKVGRFFVGGAMQNLNRQQGLRALDWQTSQKLNEPRRLIARAKENKDNIESARLQDILRQFMALQARRMEIGAQVPRATERAMGQAGLAPRPQYATQNR